MTTPDYQPSSTGSSASVLRQTAALFYDAYRELNAKRLFWITLYLSLAIVVAFAFISITPRGFTIFGKEVPSFFNSTVVPPDTFYKFVFTQFAISWWLGVIALVLALISVGSIFPDFISGGSIDLYLARPISRVRLFLTKYLTSLLFVALQVMVFCAASFIVIGVKGHVWEFGIFLAVPLVTMLFSYLFCVCVLIGLVTRSTLAAILVTLLFWIFLFALNATDGFLLLGQTVKEEQQARMANNLAAWEHWIGQQKALPPQQQSAGALKNFEFQRDHLAGEKRDVDTTVDQLRFWHGLVASARAPLPKTDETIDLMTRWLVEPDAILKATRETSQQHRQRRQAWRSMRAQLNGQPATRASPQQPAPALVTTEVEHDDPEVMDELQRQTDATKAAKIIGTSLGFEAVVIALAAWVFCRRDF